MSTAKKLNIIVDSCIANGLPESYPATWNGVSTKELFTKFNNAALLQRDMLISKIIAPSQEKSESVAEILTGMQNWLDTQCHIPTELKNQFLDLGPDNLDTFMEAAFNQFKNKWTIREFIDNVFKIPTTKNMDYLTKSNYSSSEEFMKGYVNPKLEKLEANIVDKAAILEKKR